MVAGEFVPRRRQYPLEFLLISYLSKGTNERGETGLFPFSYTTFDESLARSASSQGGAAPTGSNGKEMNATMADIDEALAGLGTRNGGSGGGATSSGGRPGPGEPRASFASERTGDFSVGETEEGANDADDDYESRAKARAALAVNAQRNHLKDEDLDEEERAEQARMKAQAQRVFEEEEARQRELLLKKEQERKKSVADGTLQTTEKPKVAPIEGVEMSDESDSEGSIGGDLGGEEPPQTHAPLFGASTDSQQQQQPSVPMDNKDKPNGSDQPRENLTANRSLSPIPSASGHSQGAQASPPVSAGTAASAAGAGAIAAAIASGSTSGAAQPLPNSAVSEVTPAKPYEERNDQRSVDSSRGRYSGVSDGPLPGTMVGSTGTAPTSVQGTETPKSLSQSQGLMAAASPAPSTVGSRPAGPGGDPHEWNVEQVVEWGRSKGWDEGAVVSKFAEHEISGDVLMEMDVNILKEIDIIAFGKRFQVANAIKDLKKAHGGATGEPSPMVGNTSWSSTQDGNSAPASANAVLQQQQQQPQQTLLANGLTQTPSSTSSFGAQPQSAPTMGSGSISQQNAFGVGALATGLAAGAAAANMSQSHSAHGGRLSPNMQQDLRRQASDNDMAQRQSVASGGVGSSGWQTRPRTAANDSQWDNYATPHSAEIMSDDEPLSNLVGSKKSSTNSRKVSQDDLSPTFGSMSPSSRKRESGGSGRATGSGERMSFFAGLAPQRNRKPPPKVQTGAAAGAPGQSVFEESPGKQGTFSRLGFNRMRGSNNQSSQHSNDENAIKNKISLPTSSPTYDSMGDTARRNRQSQQSAGSGGLANFGGYGGGHAKQASVGSAGAGAGIPSGDWGLPSPTPGEPSTPSEGPVMVRIRPVDFEGWMKKKGERYNTWKPRYLALKGSDLVLLRDPTAPKIKGYVSMKGYKVIADENTNPGKYGFKILHESEKPHYFSSDDPIVVREWMKALMKATIGRDTSCEFTFCCGLVASAPF